MYGDGRIDLLHSAQEDVWLAKVRAALEDGRMASWISSLHPQRLGCELTPGVTRGGYTLRQKVTFSDKTTGMLRLTIGGRTHPDYADEKVVADVGILALLRARTSIPVPVVHTWGFAGSNDLGLGPFILMEVAEGVSGNKLLSDHRTGTTLLREDISETNLELLFRQFARYQLELFSLDFDSLGSLPISIDGVDAPIRPLTWKSHEILHCGGVDTFRDREKGWSSSTEYFKYVFRQDYKRLFEQLNSVSDSRDARRIFRSFKVLETVIPRQLINKRWDRGPFKLICDFFGLSSLVLKSQDDFTVVGVVDLEWSYIGPPQLAASAPWWLLQVSPTCARCGDFDEEPRGFTSRYFKHLKIYKRVLREEGATSPGPEDNWNTFSELVQWSEDSGAMWLHMLFSFGFYTSDTFPLEQLRRHVGVEKWRALEEKVDEVEMEVFVEEKLLDLKQYIADQEAIKRDKARVDSGELEASAFFDRYRRLLRSGRGCLWPAVRSRGPESGLQGWYVNQ